MTAITTHTTKNSSSLCHVESCLKKSKHMSFLLAQVFGILPPKDLASIRATSKSFNLISKDVRFSYPVCFATHLFCLKTLRPGQTSLEEDNNHLPKFKIATSQNHWNLRDWNFKEPNFLIAASSLTPHVEDLEIVEDRLVACRGNRAFRDLMQLNLESLLILTWPSLKKLTINLPEKAISCSYQEVHLYIPPSHLAGIRPSRYPKLKNLHLSLSPTTFITVLNDIYQEREFRFPLEHIHLSARGDSIRFNRQLLSTINSATKQFSLRVSKLEMDSLPLPTSLTFLHLQFPPRQESLFYENIAQCTQLTKLSIENIDDRVPLQSMLNSLQQLHTISLHAKPTTKKQDYPSVLFSKGNKITSLTLTNTTFQYAYRSLDNRAIMHRTEEIPAPILDLSICVNLEKLTLNQCGINLDGIETATKICSALQHIIINQTYAHPTAEMDSYNWPETYFCFSGNRQDLHITACWYREYSSQTEFLSALSNTTTDQGQVIVKYCHILKTQQAQYQQDAFLMILKIFPWSHG